MSQMPVTSFFPNFVPNQILTNTQLNDLRKYLDDQNRLTRVRLTGTGIVCGLHAIREGAKIKISEGFGVTSEGYLIEIPSMEFLAKSCSDENPTLVKSAAYTDPDRGEYTLKNDPCDEDEKGLNVYGPHYEPWQLKRDEIKEGVPSKLPDDPKNNPVTQIEITALLTKKEADNHKKSSPLKVSDYQNKVLVLYLEFQKQGLKSCLTTDCNNKGENLNFVVRPLLIDKKELEEVKPCNGWSNPAFLPRFNRAVKRNGLAGLEDIDRVEHINDAYKEIVKDSQNFLFKKIETTFKAVKTFLHLDHLKYSNFDWDKAFKGVSHFNQYHYDFLKDVVCAYNEFNAHYCKIIDVCCPDLDFPRHLMIGSFDKNGKKEEPTLYRNEFSPSPVRNVIHHDLKKAKILFLRIVALIQSFSTDLLKNVDEEEKIRITPSQNDRRQLGEKAIPHYYDLKKVNLENVWQGAPCCSDPRLLSYVKNKMGNGSADNDFEVDEYLAAPLETLIDKNGFFRIEGHLGLECDTALSKIEELKRNFNLDFDVKLLYLQDQHTNQISETHQITEIRIQLKQISELRYNLEALLLNSKANSQEATDIRNEITAKWKIIAALNEEWLHNRLQNLQHCDLTHLRLDYLNIRSRVICSYSKIKKMLDALPDLNEIFVKGSKGITERRVAADARVAELKTNLDDKNFDFEAIKREDLDRELVRLKEERDNLARFETTLKVGANMASKINARAHTTSPFMARAFTPIETDNFQNLISQGLLLGIFNLKENIEKLCEQLPKDAKKFNYHLFIYHYKNAITSIIQLKLLASILLELLTSTLGSLQYVWRAMQVLAMQTLATHLTEISDYINCINRIQYNCFHAELATNYYTLEHLLLKRKMVFSDFAAKHTGMEHLAGVERGNTFLLVCNEEEEQSTVVADFTLHRPVDSCCCDFDPDELCLPPVALPNYRVVYLENRDEGNVDTLIDVLPNDYNLNGTQGTLSLHLPESKRSVLNERQNQQNPIPENLSIEQTLNGKTRIRYRRQSSMYALDSFTYRIEDSNCQLIDESEVLILIRPTSNRPILAQEDIAATSQDQSIDIDITQNDLLFEGTPTLSPTDSFNTEKGGNAVLTTANIGGTDKQVFRYTPPKGFVGTDRFGYKISSDGQQGLGLVNVLVVPCCDRNTDPTPPDVIITGSPVRGIVRAANGEQLPSVTVVVQNTTIGTATDIDGSYSLRLEPGSYTLEVGFAGYLQQTQNIEVRAGAASKAVNFILRENNPSVIIDLGVLTMKDLPKFKTAILTGDDPIKPDPNKAIINTFKTRHSERVETFNNFREDEVIVTTEAFQKADTFVVKTMIDATKTPEELASEYREVTNELLDAHKLSSGSKKTTYKKMLETVTHAYMDKMIIKNPNETEERMKVELEAAAEKIKKEGISVIGFKNRYGGRKLKQDFKVGVVADLNKILK